MINQINSNISIRRQAQLLQINRSSIYYKKSNNAKDFKASNAIADLYSQYPVYGYRRITAILKREGLIVNHKKVRRLMGLMNLQAIYPKPNTSQKASGDQVYPYLLSGLKINRINQVWQVDITYLRTLHGFIYLIALIDVYSRKIMGYRLSNNLSSENCVYALEDALYNYGKPDIINSDQGRQFTGESWVKALKSNNVKISMTGVGRCSDNIYIERLWRSFKYEGSYLYRWNTVSLLKDNIGKWVSWYNGLRPHQSLNYATPDFYYAGGIKVIKSSSHPPNKGRLADFITTPEMLCEKTTNKILRGDMI